MAPVTPRASDVTLQALRRSRTARGWFGVWVVLAFGLRALIPTGFMLAAIDGHARLVLCPAGIYHATSEHRMAGMDMAGMTHAAHAAVAADQCPFALAGGAGLFATVREAVEPYFVILRPARAYAAASVPVTPPPRYHAPRGPPSPA